MNELLFTNAHGLRLITGFEGDPRLKARLCEGGKFELGYGITFDLDGQPFTASSTCTPEYAEALFRNALKLFEDGVRRLVTVPLNSNQFSGLVAFAYNVGLENLAGSTVLRRVNEGRMDDAAASFGMWVFATKNGHKQALRGLLRRRYAEACLFMGYDWTEACDNDAIALQRQIPDTLPGTDRVIYKTPFKDVLSVAQGHPLDAPADLVLDQVAPAEPFNIDRYEADVEKVTAPSPPQAEEAAQRQASPAQSPAAGAAPVIEKTSATVSGSAGATPVAPPVPAPQPTPARPAPAPVVLPSQVPVGTKPPSPNTKMPEHVPYRIDPHAGLKPMEETERFVGAALMLFGTFARVILANGTAVTGVGGIAVVAVLDMMKSPTNLAILITVITMAITAVLWVFAFIIDKLGLKIKKRGEATSTQAMY